MKSKKKTLIVAVIIGVIAVFITAVNTVHISPVCEDFRDKISQLAINENSLSGTLIVVSQEAMDDALTIHYAGLSDAQCKAKAAPLADDLEAISHTSWAPKMAKVGEQVREAMRECREKRENGDLQSHADSAACSNQRIKAAFEAIQYPYMDLVEEFTKERLAFAQKLDKSMAGGSEDETDYAKLSLVLIEKEIERLKK